MIGLALLLAAAFVILLINVSAIGVGKEQRGALSGFAVVCGWLGIVCLAGFALAFFDAFTQVWVKRPDYEGAPVYWTFFATIGTSVLSLGLVATMLIRARRAKA